MILQSDFSNKVKGETKRGRQMDKRTGTGRETKNKYFPWFYREVTSGSQTWPETKLQGKRTCGNLYDLLQMYIWKYAYYIYCKDVQIKFKSTHIMKVILNVVLCKYMPQTLARHRLRTLWLLVAKITVLKRSVCLGFQQGIKGFWVWVSSLPYCGKETNCQKSK